MSVKEKAQMIAFLAFILVFVLYQAFCFHFYSCEAFKSGHLSWGYAPARCVE